MGNGYPQADTGDFSVCQMVDEGPAAVSGNDRQMIRGQLAIPGRLTGPSVASSGREATILRHWGEALAGAVYGLLTTNA